MLAFHGGGELMGEVRIIDAVGRIRAEVHHFDSFVLEHFGELELVVHARVVIANTDLHVSQLFCFMQIYKKLEI